MMTLDEVLEQVQGVDRDEFLGALAWHISEGAPVTAVEWVRCAELAKTK